uniref:Uncharacterized protein n=1 Tax=Anguilla anguilla TaxID=7936 RepID=A0A0E9P9K4_ANGAN
MMDQQAAQEKE